MDYRSEFSKWWTSEFKTIKFPHTGLVFNYFVDSKTKRFVPWTDKINKFELDAEAPLVVSDGLPIFRTRL